MYLGAGKFDLALEAVKQIDANRREYYLTETYLDITKPLRSINEKTLEQAEHFRELVDFIQTPLSKTQALLNLSVIYGKGNDDESKKKQIAVLKEAATLLTPLPNNNDDIPTLFRMYWHSLSAEGKESDIRKPIAEHLNTLDEDLFYRHYHSTFVVPSHPLQPAEFDLKLYERARLLTEKMDEQPSDPQDRTWRWRSTERWQSLLRVANQLLPPGNKERKEVFMKAFEAIMKMPEPTSQQEFYSGGAWRVPSLKNLISLADKDEVCDVLDEIVISTLTWQTGRAALQYGGPAKHVLREYVRTGNTDRMLKIIDSERLPPRGKDTYLYFDAAHALLDADAPKDEAFRAEEFKKLFGMIRDIWAGEPVHGSLINAAQKIPKRFSWYPSIQEVQEMPDPTRLEMCLLQIAVHCEQKTNVDVTPFLECLIVNLPHLHTDRYATVPIEMKIRLEMLVLVQKYSLWDERQLTDWIKQYEATVVERVPVNERFSHLHRLLGNLVKNMTLDETAKNDWIDKLLDTVRSVPEPQAETMFGSNRLDAYLQVAQLALELGLPARARAAIEAGHAYDASPLQDSVGVRERMKRLELLRAKLPE
jgi:hypothetical protein